MDVFPLQFIAPLVEIETESTRLVPSVTLHGHGRIMRIKVEDSPLQIVLPKEHVEVEVEYCGMSFTDNYLRLGIIRNYRFPAIMGSECCGVITRVGHGVSDLKVGQRVLCLRMMGGLFRRMVHVPRKHCFVVPDEIDLKDAIGLGLNYLVAHVCLFELGALKPNDVVFMQSISGGVGTAVTQLCQTLQNVTVLGTASDCKFEQLTANGVNNVFRHNDDYVQEVLKLHPEGADIIINSNGGPDIEKCFKMLKRCGTLILIGSNCTALYPRTTIWGMLRPSWDAQTVSSAELISKNYTVAGVNIGLLLNTHPEMMQGMVAKLFRLLSAEKVKPRIHAVLPFEKVADGMTQLCERQNFGKIILELKQKPTAPDEPDTSTASAEETPAPPTEEASEAVSGAQEGDKQEPEQEQAAGVAEAAVAPPEAQEEEPAAAAAAAAAAATSESKEASDAPPKEPEEKSTTEAPKDASGPQ